MDVVFPGNAASSGSSGITYDETHTRAQLDTLADGSSTPASIAADEAGLMSIDTDHVDLGGAGVVALHDAAFRDQWWSA